jgi:hypothetical protein
MEFLESTQERDAFVTAEFVKAEVLENITFASTSALTRSIRAK